MFMSNTIFFSIVGFTKCATTMEATVTLRQPHIFDYVPPLGEVQTYSRERSMLGE